MITVYIKKIESIDKKTETEIISSLSQSALARYNKKKNDALRLSSLTALSMLTNEQLKDLYYTESGIPNFKTINENISISHSKIYCAVAISDFSVGIDVEDTTREESSTNLVRFFTENEKKQIEEETSQIEIWTKKEALFKYLKNDNINFISLDTTQANAHFETINLNGAILTICCEKREAIKIQKL